MLESVPASVRLFPYRHYSAVLTALGGFIEGGRIAVIEDSRSIDIELDIPPVEFTLLAILLQRSVQRADEDSTRTDFVSKHRLFQQLKRLYLIEDPRTVARTVFRLRERLKHAVREKLGETESHAWSRSFLEHSRLGYRISAPAGNLRLALLDEGGPEA